MNAFPLDAGEPMLMGSTQAPVNFAQRPTGAMHSLVFIAREWAFVPVFLEPALLYSEKCLEILLRTVFVFAVMQLRNERCALFWKKTNSHVSAFGVICSSGRRLH